MIRRPRTVARHLLHVLPDLRISGRSMLALDVVQALPDYVHALVSLEPPEAAEETLVWSFQAAGASVLHSGGQEPYSGPVAAALLYDVPEEAEIVPRNVPTVGYSYYAAPGRRCDVALVPSEYARTHDLAGNPRKIRSDAEVLPPAVKTRAMRRVGAPPAEFSVGVFSSGYPDKYPGKLVAYLLDKLPGDIRVIATAHPELTAMGRPKRLWAVPRIVDATMKGIQMSSVVAYDPAPGYFSPYGKTCLETMAARRPLVCARRGSPGEEIVDGVHAMLFDDYGQAVDQILHLRANPTAADRMAATGQVLASWRDISGCAGGLKGILHSLGA